MAKTAEKAKAEKKVVISDLNTAVGELFDGNAEQVAQLRRAIESGLVKAEVAEVTINDNQFSGDYVKLSLGEAAVDDASILNAMRAIAGGNLTLPVTTNEKGEEEVDERAPAVTKWFLYGADLASRSRTSQRIKAAAEGPEKAIESMAKTIVKNKPGTTMEQARQIAAAVLAD